MKIVFIFSIFIEFFSINYLAESVMERKNGVIKKKFKRNIKTKKK